MQATIIRYEVDADCWGAYFWFSFVVLFLLNKLVLNILMCCPSIIEKQKVPNAAEVYASLGA